MLFPNEQYVVKKISKRYPVSEPDNIKRLLKDNIMMSEC